MWEKMHTQYLASSRSASILAVATTTCRGELLKDALGKDAEEISHTMEDSI